MATGGLAPYPCGSGPVKGAPCLAQAPRKKSGVSLGCGRPRTCVSALSIASSPRAGARSAPRERPRPYPHPRDTRAERSLPADSAPHSGGGCGGARPGYKGLHAQPSRSLSPFRRHGARPPTWWNTRAGAGSLRAEGEMERAAQLVQPAGPSPPTGIGRAWAGRVLWGLERLVPSSSTAP